MAAQQLASSNSGAPVVERSVVESPLTTSERKQLLADVLTSKVEQGYRIESQTDTEAILVMQSQRRWFGMLGGKTEIRQIASVDQQGHTRTRAE
jgi:hypothetical protein